MKHKGLLPEFAFPWHHWMFPHPKSTALQGILITPGSQMCVLLRLVTLPVTFCVLPHFRFHETSRYAYSEVWGGLHFQLVVCSVN